MCRTLQFSESAMVKDLSLRVRRAIGIKNPSEITHYVGDANLALITLFQDMAARIQAPKLFRPTILDGLQLQNARRRHSEGVISRWNFCCGLYLCQCVLQPEASSH
jgi:hypothetical protein